MLQTLVLESKAPDIHKIGVIVSHQAFIKEIVNALDDCSQRFKETSGEDYPVRVREVHDGDARQHYREMLISGAINKGDLSVAILPGAESELMSLIQSENVKSLHRMVHMLWARSS